MSSQRKKKQMPACEFIRTVETELHSIRLWISASEEHCDEFLVDDIQSCVSFLTQETNEDTEAVARRIMDLFRCLTCVEVMDDIGDGTRMTR